jgi:hypothetical protein
VPDGGAGGAVRRTDRRGGDGVGVTDEWPGAVSRRRWQWPRLTTGKADQWSQ